MACRTDVGHFSLLCIRSSEKATPILPLPQTVTSSTESPLHFFLGPNDDPSELTASLIGPGPWTFQLALLVPSACGTLHCSNKNMRAPIQITHSLKVVIRVERGDDSQVDPQTGKPRQFDIVMRMPVHILSVRASTYIFPEMVVMLTCAVECGWDVRLCQMSSTPPCRDTPRA
jgi:arrestin-related trafficking adapter 3/6